MTTTVHNHVTTSTVHEDDHLAPPETILDVQLSKDEVITLEEAEIPQPQNNTSTTETPKHTGTLSSQQTSETVEIYPLKTRLAKAIAVVLGNVKEVQKLDRKRGILKDVLQSNNEIGKTRGYKEL